MSDLLLMGVGGGRPIVAASGPGWSDAPVDLGVNSNSSGNTITITTAAPIYANGIVVTATIASNSRSLNSGIADNTGLGHDYTGLANSSDVRLNGTEKISFMWFRCPYDLPTGTVLTFTLGGSCSKATVAQVIYGVDTSTALDVVGAGTIGSGNSAAPTCTSLDPTALDIRFVGVTGVYLGENDTLTQDAGWTNYTTRTQSSRGRIALCHKKVGDGSQVSFTHANTVTGTPTSREWGTNIFPFRKA